MSLLRTLRPVLGSARPVTPVLARSYSAHHSPQTSDQTRKKVTIPELAKMRRNKEKISMVTAHDYVTGLIADKAGVDMILVGDSLAMVALGYPNTNQIELEEMVYHAKAVSRGVKSAFMVADLPFGSYEESPEKAIRSAIQMIQKGGMEAVKMEGGKELAPTIKRLTEVGIPVLGHIGLTPQRQSSLGGFRVQGKTASGAESILEDAYELQKAGCFAIVLEAVPDKVGEWLSSKLEVPTIGIGAGPGTSGQVLVMLDMLGGFGSFTPKFLKKYSQFLDINVGAVKQYHEEVKGGVFPAQEHCYKMGDEEAAKLK
ncbi:ketopantoate hydroxymethyltransferase [Yarrowia lipolytica]|uniref:3-methyl-2-oxobutanoate hydroxymethyltransferase n=2 Tax=Yarrowia lipolytica TaxID=4952 RepID=Q6CE35_YARLI|nr:YALI0B18898p [Yarrowia lipolytica CLIB122]AOW01911.1 hypothetical protein YALI1_B24638g [Yarrowia lipolytica]KAB8282506.1 ketopantoate hydroxymethyltransferase [Yarrowia lipolytica]KAE8170836.1 ketopantoate hydroxymethyltransferase [Yarrowia lipolytica]KAJ8052694.1 ketopantoate hydroxymethyltransferase [Yarrowia lipolytica]QNP97049.1 3-methyl-2-oxobutanoate hydroxymethyltransferase [Yarrowia lipolytica]|eukprot:XP_501077.1 YALI0B18898p [Yarrowia lipolytica CLIB122]